MISFHNVDKRYRLRDGYRVILDNVTAELPARNIGILGGNGAGKSTLLRMISGAELPNAGMIECERRVSFPLGFAASFNASLTGIENTLFVSRIYGQDTEAVVEYVKEFSQLGEQLYMPVQTYSSGMRARLAFGVSLAIDFELYLVDEITAVGDAKFRKRSKEAFQSKLAEANIIMVSHSMGTLRDYCDAGIILHEGQLLYYDDLEQAIEQHSLNMGQDYQPRGGAGQNGKGQGGQRKGGQGGQGQGGQGQGGQGQRGRGQGGGRGPGGRGPGGRGQGGQGGQGKAGIKAGGKGRLQMQEEGLRRQNMKKNQGMQRKVEQQKSQGGETGRPMPGTEAGRPAPATPSATPPPLPIVPPPLPDKN